MNRRSAVLLASNLCLLLILGNPAAEGALKAYLKVGEISGDSSDEIHYQWSEILSYDISVQNTGWPPGAHGTSAPTFSDMYVTKLSDSASPYYLKGVWLGQQFEEARLEVADPTTGYLSVAWLFQDVILSAYNTVFDEQLLELVAIDFGRVRYSYYPDPMSGAIEFDFDRNTNAPWDTAVLAADGFQFVTHFEATPTPEPTTLLLTLVAMFAALLLKRTCPGVRFTCH